MSDRIEKIRNSFMARAVAALIGLTAVSSPGVSRAQSTMPPPGEPIEAPAAPLAPEQPQPVPAAPASPDNPGLFNELGKLLTAPNFTLPSFPGFKSPAEAMDDLNARAKDATDGLPRMTTMVKGRTTCPVAANGAPDCKTASDRLCQSKGFKEGKSLDTDSARSCSARSLLAGGKPAESECKTENYVTRALCQ